MAKSATYRTQVGAAATVENALQNTVLERIGEWGFIMGIARHDALGGEIVATVYRNSEEMVTEATMTANANMNPNVTDDVVFQPIPIKPTDYIRLKLRETTGAATNIRFRTEFQEAPPAVVIAAAGGARGF